MRDRHILILRWRLLLGIASVAFTFIFRCGPSRRRAKWRWIATGGVLAVIVGVAATIAFAWYVQTFSRFNETFGTLAGIIILLLWLWLSAFSIVLGALIDAKMEAQTQRDSTVRPDRPVDQRDETKANSVDAGSTDQAQLGVSKGAGSGAVSTFPSVSMKRTQTSKAMPTRPLICPHGHKQKTKGKNTINGFSAMCLPAKVGVKNCTSITFRTKKAAMGTMDIAPSKVITRTNNGHVATSAGQIEHDKHTDDSNDDKSERRIFLRLDERTSRFNARFELGLQGLGRLIVNRVRLHPVHSRLADGKHSCTTALLSIFSQFTVETANSPSNSPKI